MAPKDTTQVKASPSKSSSKMDENTLLIGAGSKLKTLKIANVKNGKLGENAGTELDAIEVKPEAFTSGSQISGTFSLSSYRSMCHVDTVAAHLSRSKELKEKMQHKNVKIVLSTGNYLILVKDLNASTIQNVVSFNKACAIMSAGILKHVFEEEYDWSTKSYKKTEVAQRILPNKEIINRLAGQMGLTPSNPYYWMIVPGYEFLYELYPAEVLGYTLVRLQYRKNLNIPDKMTDTDIVSSLVMKMNRLHNLETHTFDDAINSIGLENVMDAYTELAKNVGTTSKTKRNDEAVIKFKELISSFLPSLEKAKAEMIG